MVKPMMYGRMGNTLYQIALAISYAEKHGIDFTIPNTTTSEKWNPLYCQHLVNNNWDEGKHRILINEKCHEYHELPFDESWRDKNIILNGYWQSNLYFDFCIDKIRDLMAFKWEHKPNLISVHVRRGDYLELTDKHPYVSKEWMEQAMTMFPGKTYKFFSDDIKWCVDNFSDRNDCLFSTNKSEVEDLEEISCCESHICSSSTFSVWAYNLNRYAGKKAVFPKLWFVPGYCNLVTDDIVPKECIKL